MNYLEKIEVQNFRSIHSLDLELKDLNVLIGANGAGKSNFVAFFKMLEAISTERLAEYVRIEDGKPGFFFYGNRDCGISARLSMKQKDKAILYQFQLQPDADGQLIFIEENIGIDGELHSLGTGHRESRLSCENYGGICCDIARLLANWRVFQFHETSKMRNAHCIQNNLNLMNDSANLAPYLRTIKERYPASYRQIIRIIQRIMPYFGDFELEPLQPNGENNRLDWSELNTNLRFSSTQLSDGSLRFIALTTLFMQPREMLPPLILIDEPELGLHPAAVRLLASMIKAASGYAQVIMATQSKMLVDEFQPEDIIVLERDIDDSAIRFCSRFRRLDPKNLEQWLDNYRMGDIWDKDIIGGRP